MTDAHDGKDLTKVRIRYGADGYAIYWYCLELIAADLGASEKITFELRHDAEVIGHNLKIDSARVEEIMRYMIALELFEQSSDTITCLKLAKYLDKKSTRNTTIHKIIDSASLLSGTKPDVPGLSGLDRDTDLDTDTEVKDKSGVASQPPRAKFIKPTLEEVTAYCKSRNNTVNPQRFMDKHDANGWVVGKGQPMKDWRATVRTWETNEYSGGNNATRQPVDNSAIGQVRAANERARQRESANRQPDAPSVGAHDDDVRAPLEG